MMSCKRVLLSSILSSSENATFFWQEFKSALLKGALCIYPTETIYGIGALYGSSTVEEKVFEVKKRPPGNQLIVLSASRIALAQLDLVWPTSALSLANTFWPNNLTLVLPYKTGSGFLGIRCTSHPFMKALEDSGVSLLYSTSANCSGVPYVNDVDAIYSEFKETIEYCIDAGVLPISSVSTVVRVSSENKVEILREGALCSQRIFEALKNVN